MAACVSSRMILRALQYFLYQRNHPVPIANQPDTAPTSGVELPRFMGRWFEMARFETPFEWGMDSVWAEYVLRPDGCVSITNHGRKSNGDVCTAHARATHVSDSILMVSFVPFLHLFATPYHILKVDDEYRNALVSNESGSCMWLLSRSPHATLPELLPLLLAAADRGFNLHSLRPTHHAQGPFLP